MPDPRGARRGDLHVEVQVEIPRKLDDEHEALLRKLAEYENTKVAPHHKSWLEKFKDFIAGDDEEEEK
jgi:molecular chaperone DnaJ